MSKLLEMPANSSPYNYPESTRSEDLKAALEELFKLLEDYSPSWYSEETHDRALAALQRCYRKTRTNG